MDILLVTSSFNDEIHGSDDKKKTGCGISLIKPENISRYRIGGVMTDLKEISCDKCKERLAKKIIRSDKKEMSKLLKEERARAKRGIEDEGIVPLGNTTAKITRSPEQIRREEEAKAEAARKEAEAQKRAEEEAARKAAEEEAARNAAAAQKNIPGTGVAMDNSLAQFAINVPKEEEPAPEPVQDDFLAQFAIQKPEDDAVEEPETDDVQDDFLAQFAIPTPQQDEYSDAEEDSSHYGYEDSSATYDNDSSVINVSEDELLSVENEPETQPAEEPAPAFDANSDWDFVANQIFGFEGVDSSEPDPVPTEMEELPIPGVQTAAPQNNAPEIADVKPEVPGLDDIVPPVLDDIVPPALEDIAPRHVSENISAPVLEEMTAPAHEEPVVPVQESITAPVLDDLVIPEVPVLGSAKAPKPVAVEQAEPQPEAPVNITDINDLADLEIPEVPTLNSISSVAQPVPETAAAPVETIETIEDIIENTENNIEDIVEETDEETIPEIIEDITAVEEIEEDIDEIAAEEETVEPENITEELAELVAPVIPEEPVIPAAPIQTEPVQPVTPVAPVQTAPVQPVAPVAPIQAAPVSPVAPAAMQQPQVISVPQFAGYDPTGQPIYTYVQMQMTGYDQNGQPIFIPLPGQQPPVPPPAAPQRRPMMGMSSTMGGQMGANIQKPVVQLDAPTQTPDYIKAKLGEQISQPSANISKIAVNPHSKETSKAFVQAISSSKNYANQNLIETQGLRANTPVLSSIEDVLSQMGDNSLKNQKKVAQQEVNLGNEYRASASRPASPRTAPPARKPQEDVRLMTKKELAEKKKQDKYAAKFKKDLAKRGF